MADEQQNPFDEEYDPKRRRSTTARGLKSRKTLRNTIISGNDNGSPREQKAQMDEPIGACCSDN